MHRLPLARFGLVTIIGPLLLISCSGNSLPFSSGPQPVMKVVTVERGSVVSTIPATGIVSASTQVPLSVRTTGVVKDVKVQPGDSVKAGQELVVLSAPDLAAQVQVAKAGVELAQAKLAQALAGSTSADIGIAQAQVDAATAKLASLTQQGRAEDIVSARSGVDAAQARLDAMLSGGDPATVAQAQQQVQIAQAKLDAIDAGGKAEVVAQAQQQVQIAQAKLDAIDAGATAATVAQAQAKLDQAQAQLTIMQQGVRPKQIAVYQEAIAKARNDLWAAQIARDAASGRPDSPKYLVDQGNAQVAAAQTALDQATKQLQLELAAPTAAQIAEQQAVVAQAKAVLQAAKQPYTAQDKAQAAAVVAQAKAALQAAKQPYTPQDRAEAIAAVNQAKAALAGVEQPNTPQAIRAARDAVVQAQQNLAKTILPYQQPDIAQAAAALDAAQQQLDAKKHPYTTQDIAVLKASVDMARAQLAVAQASFDATVLKAPFDGVVQQVNVVPGELVTSGAGAAASTLTDTPMIVLGSGKLVVQMVLDETDIAKVKAGQPITYTFDSLPQTPYVGKVTVVPQVGTITQGVMSYSVVGSIAGGGPLAAIKPGMTGNVAVQVAKRNDVLRLPYQTIQIFNGQASVNLMNPGDPSRPIHRDVTLGLTDGSMIQIVKGLKAGDRVLQFGWREDIAQPSRPGAGASAAASSPANNATPR